VREPSVSGAVRGVVLAANLRDEPIPTHAVRLLGQVCAQTGAALANCAWATNQVGPRLRPRYWAAWAAGGARRARGG
jgi:hypothetical protein